MVSLAKNYDGEAVSTRVLAEEQEVSYQLACKLMQQLHAAKLVESLMGPKGGFRLSRRPAEISLSDVIEVFQGPVSLNRCLLNEAACPRRSECPVRRKIGVLQDHIDEFLGAVTLEELARSRGAGPGTNAKRLKED